VALIRTIIGEMLEDCLSCDGVGSNGYTGHGGAGVPLWCHACRGRGTVLSENGSMLLDALLPFLGEHYAEKDHGHHLS
jgi:hypothetical protein